MEKRHFLSGAGHPLAWLLMTLCLACSSDDLTDVIDNATPTSEVKVKMRLYADISQFDNAETRADYSWPAGAKVYMQFKNGATTVSGFATRNSSGEWDASFNGTLASKGTCEVYYFERATQSGNTVALELSTPIFADKSGTFTLSGSDLSVTASLKPMTSRLRLKGDNGLQASIDGLTAYTGYNVSTNQFTTRTYTVGVTVGTSGYTPYVYCLFTDQSQRKLTLTNSQNGTYIRFEKTFGTDVLRQGESGYFTIPTTTSNKGWAVTTVLPTNPQFTVTGNGKTVTFTMVKVNPGTFQMGSTVGDSDEQPVHRVTISKVYYMGQTEVTQALWYAVMGQSPTSDGSKWSSSYGQGDNYPAYCISWNDCQTFINSLNTKLSSQLGGMKFRMPTEAEWEFAARGGTSSKGYTYAGSNTIGEVAWYSNNAASATHAVKSKSANELGLYDMSGNVWEWCQDWYGSYLSLAQTDPTGPSSASLRVIRGGGWGSSVTYCRTANRSFDEPLYRGGYNGLRLALQ